MLEKSSRNGVGECGPSLKLIQVAASFLQRLPRGSLFCGRKDAETGQEKVEGNSHSWNSLKPLHLSSSHTALAIPPISLEMMWQL